MYDRFRREEDEHQLLPYGRLNSLIRLALIRDPFDVSIRHYALVNVEIKAFAVHRRYKVLFSELYYTTHIASNERRKKSALRLWLRMKYSTGVRH